ncbi:MAG TPA: hypothetical protein ENN73_04010, partial [Firmicutes bacterium]|nr:hypothetical protein [Bacillota bacterium]
MKKDFKCGLLILLLLVLISVFGLTVYAGDIKGDMIYDYYKVERNNNKVIEGMHGFRFRRVNITYDEKIKDNISIRFRLELVDPGDFVTKEYYLPVLKDNYIKFKTVNKHEISLGVMGPPTFEVVESLWGWRVIERTPLDLHKYASSRDIGLSFKKPYSKDCKFNYTLMLANGTGNKSEDNKGKKTFLTLGFSPYESMYFELYGDIDYSRGNKYKYTNQGFLGILYPKFKLGLLYAVQTHVDRGEEESFEIASVFVTNKLTSELDIILRYDKNFQANSKGDEIAYAPYLTTHPVNLVIFGISYRLNDKIKV